ncbi:H-2 class II histocompatibility antigen, A-F beta chain-like isoform X1 [Neoarius graeffei]|uniref:H-2 class II histocompatibility antigen, A-F beta chain-like isoform X1 n=1 Tax=Neoarius graeffei TaxID=443677 RepID=UPI00298C07D1|nr:H-2 class II histocompatibility antigen, A-F beta chain-like isoform X1 [Neoarius graeffei]
MRLCAVSFLCIMQVLFTLKAVNGYYGHQYFLCYFSQNVSTVEFIYSWYFNKLEYVRYNSTSDKYMGFTDSMVSEVEQLNQDPSNSLSFLVGEICLEYRNKFYNSILKTVKPEVLVRLLRPEVDLEPAVLVCSAYDYYPKGIKVSWLRNGEVISDGVSSTDELSNGDWYYQMHSYLEYRLRPGENISCIVEHESLTQPLIHTWEASLPEAERNKLIIGIFFLAFGIVLAIAGFLYYMLSCRECPAEPTSQSISLERTVSETSSEASNL